MDSTPPLVLRLREPLRDYPLAPGVDSVELDRSLAEGGARGWTLFLGLGEAGEDEGKARRKARAKLVKLGAQPAELVEPDSAEPPLEGWLVTDLKGTAARRLGRELGVARILRGVVGRPFDPTPMPTENESRGVGAQRGLNALAATLRELPARLEPTRVFGLAAATLLLAAWAALYFTRLTPQAWLRAGHVQVVGPLLFFGAYLRLRLHGDHHARSLPTPPGWEGLRHELLVIWIVTVPLVLLFGAAELHTAGNLHATTLLDGLPMPLVLVLWILPALSLARSSQSLFGNLLAAGIQGILSVFLLKLASAMGAMVTGIVGSFSGQFLRRLTEAPFLEPARVALELLAELVFLTYLLGYAWSRQRPWFDGEPDPLEA